MWKIGGAVLVLSVLTACNTEPTASAKATCFDLGLQPGTEAYNQCAREETSRELMEIQRREYEQRKFEDEYWRQRRY